MDIKQDEGIHVDMRNPILVLTICLSIIIIVLAIEFKAPWWSIVILALILVSRPLMGFWARAKNPSLGFENMVGKTGLTVEPIKRKGTVRIGHELWQATARENIEQGAEVMVVSQSGLELIVVKK